MSIYRVFKKSNQNDKKTIKLQTGWDSDDVAKDLGTNCTLLRTYLI